MKHLLQSSAGACALLSIMIAGASQANAAEFFVGAHGGLVMDATADVGGSAIELEQGFAFGGEAGLDFGNFRASAVAEKASADIGVLGQASITTESARVALALPFAKAFKPYVSGEYGLAQAEVTTTGAAINGDGQVYAYGVGVDFDLPGEWTASAEYQRHSTANLQISGTAVDAEWAGVNVRFRRAFS